MPAHIPTLRRIVCELGGELYDGGRRANVPAPGHSPADRSVSLWLNGERVLAHGFGRTGWREVLDDLRARGLIGPDGRVVGGDGTLQGRPTAAVVGAREREAAAARLWADGRAIGARTPAAAYLRRRAAPVAEGGSEALRAHPAAPLAVYRPTGRTLPALMAAISTPDGAVGAVELTYLTAAGRRADGLRLPRKTVGRLPRDGAVRLDGVGPELLVAEGVFTAISAGLRFSLPAWALLSASRMSGWSPPDGVRRLVVAADRGRAGEAAAAALAARARAAGLRVEVRLPPFGQGDWNEVAVREAEGGREGAAGARGTAPVAGPEMEP